jgi:hypothetical protein
VHVATEYFGRDGGPAWTPVSIRGHWMEGFLHEISALAVVWIDPIAVV